MRLSACAHKNKYKKENKMETTNQDQIRQSVRKAYGKVAKAGRTSSGESRTASCCGPSDISTGTSPAASCCSPSNISEEKSSRAQCGCGDSDFTLEQVSSALGYSMKDLESVPDGANMGLGCGNPVALASLTPGETVVDLGSGGGFDCFLAAKEVGETGKVIGIDMTPDMISKARANAEKVGTDNVEFRLGEIEHLPVADNSADIVMSNCVINLSPDKLSVFQDAYRILKPGGRLSISDILATAPLPEEIQKDLALVAACVGGAATIADTEQMLREAGFQDIKITPKDNSRELIEHWNPTKSENPGDYIVSAYIEAVKPG
jgi:SAM-dependent methyltransferase